MPTYATCLGFAYDSPTVEFPVRMGPGTTFDTAPFKIAKGTGNLEVLEVQPDSQNTASDLGRVYNWFKIKFPNGQIGWMRGHVIGISGDFSAFGYGNVATLVHEYTLTRNPASILAAAAAPAANPMVQAEQTAQPANPMAQAAQAAQQPAAAQPEKKTDNSAKEAEKQAAVQAAASGQQVAASGTAPVLTGTWQPIRPAHPAKAKIKVSSAAKGRNDGTTVGTTVVTTIPRDTVVPVIGVKQENQGQKLRWLQVSYNGQNVWVREDFTTIEGDGETHGLQWDLYPAPMGEKRWWIRGVNRDPKKDTSIWDHSGWDLGAAVGEPVLCGPAGGVVAKVFDCPKCTPDKPSVMDHGLKVGDPSLFTDEGWGYGYGNYVIITYSNDKLPPSTKNFLAANGFPGGAFHVMYAHLQRRTVEAGQILTPNQQIGANGNSGNSEGPHVHLECRADFSDKFTRWGAIEKGFFDPVVLFQR